MALCPVLRLKSLVESWWKRRRRGEGAAGGEQVREMEVGGGGGNSRISGHARENRSLLITYSVLHAHDRAKSSAPSHEVTLPEGGLVPSPGL